MILEWFVDMVLGLAADLIALVPWPETVMGELGAFDALFGVMGTFNVIAPVTEALAASAVVLSVTSVLFVYRVIKTLVAHIPGIGGTG
jgi:hypothetical protein